MQASLYDRQLAELTASWNALPDKPQESPELSLRALWLTASGNPVSSARVRGDLPELRSEQIQQLHQLVQQRKAGVPLAHLTGRQTFMGLEMLSAPAALIPRKETELLASTAISAAKEIVERRGQVLVIDLCTGSGNVALAVAAHVPEAHVFGADIAPDAIDLAQRNANFLDATDRVSFVVGDLFEPFEREDFLGSVDLITCNPPYISSTKVPLMPEEISAHEPRLAFDGGAFGVDILLRLIANAPRFLAANSCLCFEVGLGQGDKIAERVMRSGRYRSVETVRDMADHTRVVTART